MKSTVLLILLIVCSSIGHSSEASPVRPDDSSPSLSAILGIFKGGTDIHTLLKYLNELKTAGSVIADFLQISPPLKKVVDATAKRNIKFKVLMKAAEGEFPDLQDLYHLATSKSDNMFTDLYESGMNDTEWVKLRTLMAGNSLQSYDMLAEGLRGFTGGKVDIPPSVIKAVESGGNATLTKSTASYADLIDIMMLYHDNYFKLWGIFRRLFGNPIDFPGIVRNIVSLNMTFTPTFNTASRKIKGGKYEITGGGLTDPDVSQLMTDMQHLKTLDVSKQGEVQATVLDMVEMGMKIFTHAITEAEEASGTMTKSGTTDLPPVVLG